MSSVSTYLLYLVLSLVCILLFLVFIFCCTAVALVSAAAASFLEMSVVKVNVVLHGWVW